MTQLPGATIDQIANRSNSFRKIGKNPHDINQYYYIDRKGRIDPDDIIGIDDKTKEDISCTICTFVHNQ